MEKVYCLSNIEEYGKFISFCIENDISVFRTYWDERFKGERCYHIDWKTNNCYYCDVSYYSSLGYEIVKPVFYLDDSGNYYISDKNE